MNFAKDFGFTVQTWNLTHAQNRVRAFVDAAKNSGFTLTVFLDAGIQTDEAMEKWRSRREEEVRCEIRQVPQGQNVLLGDMFRACGVEVFYSPADGDNDDCIAACAHV